MKIPRTAAFGPCLALALTLLMLGCATSRIDASWTNPAYAGKAVQAPVLVVGLTRDATLRRLYEDALAGQLAQQGVAAVKSYDELPDSLSEAGSERLLQAARAAGAGAVLATAVLGREQQLVFDPMPAWGWAYPGYGYYWPYTTYPYPAAVSSYERYVASTSLTDVASGKVIWSARSSTDLPGDLTREVQALAREIVAGLAKAGLLRGA